MDDLKEWIPDRSISHDTEQLTIDLLEAAQRYPLIEIAKSEFGVTIGGIGLHFPFSLSDIYASLLDTQNYLLSQESASIHNKH